jgi:hypothetical protein
MFTRIDLPVTVFVSVRMSCPRVSSISVPSGLVVRSRTKFFERSGSA